MTRASQDRLYTVEEYFALEVASEEKYEFHKGRIVPMRGPLAMAGGAVNHALIATNISGTLRELLRGSPCRAFGSDLRVRIPRKSLYFYPDVSVVCDPMEIEPHRAAGDTVTNPRLIVEVLSPSTELYDRGKKLMHYLDMPSLQGYVLVSQNTACVESYLRLDDGSWSFTHAQGVESTIVLRSIKVSLPLTEVYAGMELPPDEDLDEDFNA